MPILIKLEPSKNPRKKWNAVFRLEGNKFKTVSFGDPKRDDFLKHNDLKRRDNFLSRSQRNLRTGDPLRPGFLSYYITWSGFEQKGRPTRSIPKLIKMYNKKFFKK
jgi:hypothetical protein